MLGFEFDELLVTDFRFRTKKQQRQYDKIKKKLPALIKNETFMSYVTSTSMNNDLTIEKIDDNLVIKFTGFYVSRLLTYRLTCTLDKCENCKIESHTNQNWGKSEIKFMPNIETDKIVITDDNGAILYAHNERNITYIKQVPNKNNIIDPNRSGHEVYEKILIDDGVYLEASTDIKGQTKFNITKILKHHFTTYQEATQIPENTFMSLGNDYVHLSPRVKKR